MVIEMPVQVAVPDLIKVLERLPSADLDSIFTQINQIRQQRNNEATLLAQIYRRLPVEQEARLKTLHEKLEQETISKTELDEFQKLIQITETMDARRAEALLSLAQIRGTNIRQFMQDLKLDLQHE